MATIELNDQYTGEWTVFQEEVYKYDDINPLTPPVPITASDCDDIIYKQVNNKFYRRVLVDDTVNVQWFGATGEGIASVDDSMAVLKACEVKKNIYFPAGIYHININVQHKAKIFGAGSGATFLKPYDENKPIMILSKNLGPFWQYATTIEGLTFLGENKKGCGVSMAKAVESEYEANDENNSNITFRNVDFKKLNKGLQCLFGNIGMDFYSVGIHDNKYGMYFLDNKFGNDSQTMHAGNKYFYSGEISNNEVGIYIHNSTQGFGAVSFNNAIFEFNYINTYIYNDSNSIIPIVIDSCWNEASGSSTYSNPVTIDTWSGTTKGEKVVTPHAHIFEGKSFTCNVYNSWVSDYYINGDNIIVKATNCYTESSSGVGAAQSNAVGNNSYLILYRPITIFGLPTGNNVIMADSYDYNRQLYINSDTSASLIRPAISTARFNKVTDIKNKIKSVTMKTEETLTGSFPPIQGSLVNDSLIFESSNKFNIPFPTLPSGGDPNYEIKYMGLQSSVVSTNNNTGGWYVITFDVKINSGDPTLFLWNRNQYQVMQYKPTVKNKWQTIVCYAVADPNNPNLEFFLDVSAFAPVELQLSAYQVLKFDTSIEAKAFLESKVYAL